MNQISRQYRNRPVAKSTPVFALLLLGLSPVPMESAMAQPSKNLKTTHQTTVKAGQNAGRLETIEPKEDQGRERGGWNGSYVGLNAGAGFGATVGTNLVVPLGSSSGK